MMQQNEKNGFKICFIVKLMMLMCVGVGGIINPSLIYANELATFANLSVEANPYTGSASFGVPINVPAGRAGLQPNLQLSYNSSGAKGLLGVGWSLELGCIQRSTKHGVPSYSDADTFVLLQQGNAQELVFDQASGYYYPKNESAFMRIEKRDGMWVMTDKNGTKYLFGQSVHAREYHPHHQERVMKWALERVEDVHGNYMSIGYDRRANSLYLDHIHYTGHSLTQTRPFATVVFNYEKRPDKSVAQLKSTYETYLNDRIKSLEIFVEGDLQRRYDIDYVQSPITGRSLVQQIQLVGADGVSVLPPMTFEYQNELPGFDLMKTHEHVHVGDNLWNVRMGAGFDRGHDDFMACGFDVNMGQTHTKASGSGACGSYSVNINTGQLYVDGGQDCANEAWTYVYSSTNKTIQLNRSGSAQGLCVAVNGKLAMDDAGQSIPLKTGWNVIQYFFHGQHARAELNITSNLVSQVDMVNSKALTKPQLTGDFNGDGLTDLMRVDGNDIKVSLANGSSFFPEQSWLTDASASLDHIVYRAGDFNGDGKTDLLRANKHHGEWAVLPSLGDEFEPYQGHVWLSGFARNRDKISLGDFDGDGYLDIVHVDNDRYAHIALNRKGRFEVVDYTPRVIGHPIEEVLTVDWNGDGLADFAGFERRKGVLRIKLNPGSLDQEFLDGYIRTLAEFGLGRQIVVADFNQDGLIDVGYYNHQQGKIVYRLLNNTYFGDEKTWSVTFNKRSPNVQITTADFNGDVAPDFIAFDALGHAEIAMSYGDMPDMLSRIDNGVGGYTSIEYIPINRTLQTAMPFPMQVVKHVTTSTSLGDHYRTYTEYRDGLWDARDREFRGFGTVRVIDAEGNVVESMYHQDDIYQGLLKQQDTYDDAENLYARVMNTYSHQEIVEGSRFVYLKRKDNIVYDGDQDGRRTAEEYFYEESPQRGNLTKTIQFGEVDEATGDHMGQDSRTVSTTYIHNEEKYLIGLPQHMAITDHAGQTMRQTWFYYDQQALDVKPTTGLLTRKEEWSPDSDHGNPQVEYEYDRYGNLSLTRDSRGETTRIVYDDDYHLFPLKTTNPLGHEVMNQYYGINGLALDEGDGLSGMWGQLKSTTDPNDEYGLKSYDVFGRALFSVGPNDTVNLPSTVVEYHVSDRYSCVNQAQRVQSGEEDVLSSYSCYDGLGRLVFSQTDSETVGEYVISGLTQYNSRGLAIKKYFPRFSQDPYQDIDPSWPHESVEYDPVGRVVKSISPDGTYSNMEYRDWTTVTYNANGHKQENDYDAFGRLIEKREYKGADGRAAQYYPQQDYTVYSRTQYEYDSEGNLLKTVDAHDNITAMTYDKLGRKLSMNDPDMGVWSYQYDVSGNMVRQVDAKNQIMAFVYDKLNRLTQKTDGGKLDVKYTYDDPYVVKSKGRITRAAYNEDQEHARFAYDPLGREIQSVKMFNDMQYQVDREYDALNRLSEVAYPHRSTIKYTYNRAGQIESVIDSSETGVFVR